MEEIIINKPKPKMVGTRVSYEAFNSIDKKAKKEGVTVSEVLRAIVMKWVSDQK